MGMRTKPTKRTVERDRDPSAESGKAPDRPAGAQPVDASDSEDESGTYAEPGSSQDTGESDTGVTEPAPHFRVPAKKKKRRTSL